MAIMLITHDLGVIAEMADEVVVMYLGLVAERGPVDDIFHAPKHPYTRALLSSIPSISGAIPHPYNRPTGCPFHPRCPEYMKGVCEEREPRLVEVGQNQKASCFLYEGAWESPSRIIHSADHAGTCFTLTQQRKRDQE